MGSLRTLRRKERPEPEIIPKPSDLELIEAVCYGTVKQVKALLERGANPNATDEGFDNVLGHAVSGHKLGKTQLLVKHGANVNKRDSCQDTALNIISMSVGQKSQKISMLLIDHGADVNAAGCDGWTPLMRAVVRQQLDFVKILLEKGANPKLRNFYGKTALDLVDGGMHTDAIKALLEPIS
jgi:ankyrin repeat protein